MPDEQLAEILKSLPTKQSVADFAQQWAERQSMVIRRGWLGMIFGDSDRTVTHIAAVVLLAILLTGSLFTFVAMYRPPSEKIPPILDFWRTIIPLATACMGYLFGHRERPTRS